MPRLPAERPGDPTVRGHHGSLGRHFQGGKTAAMVRIGFLVGPFGRLNWVFLLGLRCFFCFLRWKQVER